MPIQAQFKPTAVPGIPQPPERIKKIRWKIAVMSGKGGVGKTTVAVNIAAELSRRGYSVGIFDSDITGPNVPKALGMLKVPIYASGNSIIPAEGPNGIKVISMGLMIREGDPVIWRGPLKNKFIQEVLNSVEWGDLDWLVVDLPPGTGDEPLSVMQLIPLDGVVIVTTPQEVALMDVRRAIHMARKMEVRVLGIVENMSYLRCPNGDIVRIFAANGGKKLAEEEGVPFLAEVPMDPEVSKLTDLGIPIALNKPESEVGKAFQEIVDKIVDQLGAKQEEGGEES